MEKEYLLKELANLKRIIKNYEVSHEVNNVTSQDTNKKSSVSQTNLTNNGQSIKNNYESSYHNHKSKVFVNPKKLNSNLLKSVDEINQHVNRENKEVSKTTVAKIYINPNFKSKCPLPKSQPHPKTASCNKISSLIKESTSNHINYRKSPQVAKSSLIEELTARARHHQRTDVPKQPDQEGHILKNRCKIFINPNYTMPSNLDSKEKATNLHAHLLRVNDGPAISKENLTEHLKPGSGSKIVVEVPSMTQINNAHSPGVSGTTSSKKRSIYLNESNIAKELPLKRKKKSEEESFKYTKTIFLNPRFKTRFQDLKGMCTADETALHLNIVSKHIPVHTTERPQRDLVLKTIPVHTTKRPQRNKVMEKESSNQTCSSTSVLASPSRCLIRPVQPIKQANSAKLVNQRKRSCSTSLVAVSTTKLIRKRKSSKSFESNVKTNLNQPVFLSKTKLVRSPPSKGLNNKIIGKTKVKRILPKSQLELLNPDKINKLRKQSFTNSITNLINVIPNRADVTKIRSKNGKSLRLIRKDVESNTPITESSNTNSLIITQKRKMLLRQQLRKNALCVVQKLRKDQFSKINVPMKKKMPHSLCENKYVYKKGVSTPRQTPIKSAVNTNKQNHTPNKLKGYNHLSEKTKFIRSKYRIIRKQCCKSISKSQKLRNEVKKVNHSLVFPSTPKRKWKIQNSGSKMRHIRKELSIVNIGGIFYRCSRTSLSRNKSSPNKIPQKQSKGLLLHIRGQKFQLENNGQTLRCLDKTPGRKRIDIGGVTFITSSSGSSLTRTNYHTARSILVQAKQKSLAQFTRKLKKNNEPCPFFHRLGRCTGKDRGTCVRLHDPKYIAVCKKFIQGLCEDSTCPLSHKISCHNMPTCQHFLAGHCGRDNCPYPHIKVSDAAPICLDFLRGFCVLGDQCNKRHLQICPSFEKGLCPRGKYCPYPHPKSKSALQLKGKFKHLERKCSTMPPRDPDMVSSSSLRYFEDLNLQKENKIALNEDPEKPEECGSEGEEETNPLKKRPKLGRLPSFIPLCLDCNDCPSEETKLQ